MFKFGSNRARGTGEIVGPVRRYALALAVALCATCGLYERQVASRLTASTTTDQSVVVEGTAFQIREGGQLIEQAKLKGAIVSIKDNAGHKQSFRIDGAMPDPKDPEIELYSISIRDPQDGQWGNMCQPGPDGLAMGFPLSGEWTPDGRHVPSDSILLTCTAGAIGKCVRFGYKPWKTGSKGEPLWQYHQACTRMVRADYCGDGTSWTRDGTTIDYFDRLNINAPDREQGMAFEAVWSTTGALCVAHTRIPELATLDTLRNHCPTRLMASAEQCSESTAFRVPGALVGNKSFAKN